MENLSEYSNEHSNSIIAGKFPDELRDSQLLRKIVLRGLYSEFIRLTYAAP
jgi:hypothetical protein